MGQFRYLLITTATGRRFGVAEMYDGVNCWYCLSLKFRSSVPGAATEPQKHVWSTALFGKIEHTLPGLEASKLTEEVTYPRFVNIDEDMLLSYRIGQ